MRRTSWLRRNPVSSCDSPKMQPARLVEDNLTLSRAGDIRTHVRSALLSELRAVDREWLDRGDLVVGQRWLRERSEVVLELGNRRCADQRRGHLRLAQHPGERELRKRLPAVVGDVVERPHA